MNFQVNLYGNFLGIFYDFFSGRGEFRVNFFHVEFLHFPSLFFRKKIHRVFGKNSRILFRIPKLIRKEIHNAVKKFRWALDSKRLQGWILNFWRFLTWILASWRILGRIMVSWRFLGWILSSWCLQGWILASWRLLGWIEAPWRLLG